MTDIELVVKIPEVEYEHLTNKEKFYSLEKNKQEWLINKILNRVIDGTLLPKGHGRLIDADKLKAELKEHHDFYVNAYGGFRNLPINDKSRVDEITGSIASVVNSKTIIEAD